MRTRTAAALTALALAGGGVALATPSLATAHRVQVEEAVIGTDVLHYTTPAQLADVDNGRTYHSVEATELRVDNVVVLVTVDKSGTVRITTDRYYGHER